jgi:hypothetical protein
MYSKLFPGIILIVALIGLLKHSAPLSDFEMWKAEYRVVYSRLETAYREVIFR